MKNILIAGGTDGIGLALMKCINPSQYDRIYVIGRDFSRLELLHISNVIQLPCNVTDQNAVNDALTHIDQPLDQFINTIGTFYRSSISDIKPKDVSQHFELNCIANINLTKLN